MKADRDRAALIYDSLGLINRNFEQILQELSGLQRQQWFRKRAKLCLGHWRYHAEHEGREIREELSSWRISERSYPRSSGASYPR